MKDGFICPHSFTQLESEFFIKHLLIRARLIPGAGKKAESPNNPAIHKLDCAGKLSMKCLMRNSDPLGRNCTWPPAKMDCSVAGQIMSSSLSFSSSKLWPLKARTTMRTRRRTKSCTQSSQSLSPSPTRLRGDMHERGHLYSDL